VLPVASFGLFGNADLSPSISDILSVIAEDQRSTAITDLTTRPASADRTACRQFQAVFPVVTGNFPTNMPTRRYEAKCVQHMYIVLAIVQALLTLRYVNVDKQMNQLNIFCCTVGIMLNPGRL